MKKTSNSETAWMWWTAAEGCTKTFSKVLQKIVGLSALTYQDMIIATAIIGAIQAVIGFYSTKYRELKMFSSIIEVVGACLFGVGAFAATFLCFIIFSLGGDTGVNSFIITLSIIPGALIDWYFFSHTLKMSQWIGIIVAILAGYTVLGCPSLKTTVNLPLWVWLSFITMIIISVNQGITQKIKNIDPMAKNFWGGLTTIVLCILTGAILASCNVRINIFVITWKLWAASSVIGLIVVAMWSFNVLSYKFGAYITLKKLVLNTVHLSSVMIISPLFFHSESYHTGKFIGILLYLIALGLMDEKIYNFLKNKIIRR